MLSKRLDVLWYSHGLLDGGRPLVSRRDSLLSQDSAACSTPAVTQKTLSDTPLGLAYQLRKAVLWISVDRGTFWKCPGQHFFDESFWIRPSQDGALLLPKLEISPENRERPNIVLALVSTVEWINVEVLDPLIVCLLLGAGIWFTLRSRCLQLRLLPLAFRLLHRSFSARSDAGSGVSTFQALCTSLASHVGTSNLAGVALAISLGGPGAVFWMWVMAVFGMATAFVENTLAQVYKTRAPDGSFRGGPAYYMEKALGQRWLGVIFSFLLMAAFGFSFNAVQANSVSAALADAFGLPHLLSALGLVVLSALVIFRGLHGITRFAAKVVPVMTLFYVAISLFIVLSSIDQLPAILSLVVRSAFGLDHAVAGGAGYMVSQAIAQGIRRGLFSNEAGMGSAPNLHATATPSPAHPATQGLVSMFSVFFDTLVICSATAAIVLVSGVDYGGEQTGIVLTQAAMKATLGDFGPAFIAITSLLFGLTSVVANAFYGESSLRFISGKDRWIPFYRVLVLVMVSWGALTDLPAVWTMADFFMLLMALMNLVVILILSRQAFVVLDDFEREHKQGLNPVFLSRKLPNMGWRIDQDIWGDSKGQ